MTWPDKQIILRRLGHINFSCEDEYDEWYKELDTPVQKRISKAICEAEEFGLPRFDWNRAYFKTNNNNGTNYKTKQQELPA